MRSAGSSPLRWYTFSGTRIAQVSIRMAAAATHGCDMNSREKLTARIPMR